MTQDPLTLYKLIVLYMLNKVKFKLTYAQISEFILEKEYTNFLTLQEVICDLQDTALKISAIAVVIGKISLQLFFLFLSILRICVFAH